MKINKLLGNNESIENDGIDDYEYDKKFDSEFSGSEKKYWF